MKIYILENKTKSRYSRDFDTINEKMYEVGDIYAHGTITEIEKLEVDCEQGNDEAYKYDCYDVTVCDKDGDEYYYYIAALPAEYDYDDWSESINKDLFESLRNDRRLQDCRYSGDFVDIVPELADWQGGSNAEYCGVIVEIFGIDTLNEVLKKYGYIYNDTTGELDYV